MEAIAKFEKISFEQFKKDWASTICDLPEDKMRDMYENIKLPARATSRSAGYDFFLPASISMDAGSEMLIPTGIRCRMNDDYALIICPKSGLGSKFRFQLNNTFGLIDADYYYSDNEGHMFCKVINDNRQDKQLVLDAGAKFVQGFFIKYGITEDDSAEGTRNGGFGSTGK